MRSRADYCYEIPQQPEPQTFAVDRVLTYDELMLQRMEPKEFRRMLKSKIARQLAEYIAENTQLIDLGDDLQGNPHLRVQVTFHDRGTYENWLPMERNKGMRDGAKLVIDALPYGFNPSELYE